MSSSPVDIAFLEDQVLKQKEVLAKTIEMLEPNLTIGHPPPCRNPTELWTKAKRNITIRRKISQHFLPRSVSVSTQYAERILNKTTKAINESFPGLKLILQGFQIYYV